LNSGCADGTRKSILGDIKAWINDANAPHICWLIGKAGSGKSSIAKTVCQSADDEAILGGSFFCSRSSGLAAQRDIRYVIPTLSQLLALRSPEFRRALADNITPNIQHKEVLAQIECLLCTPLLALKESGVPILFVIDALDECGGDTSDKKDELKSHVVVTSMIEALFKLPQCNPKLAVKFLVTSRPEPQIRDTPISDDNRCHILRLDAVHSEEVTADISRYITTTLDARLYGNRTDRAKIADNDVKELVQICNGLFIVAATAVDYTFDSGADAAVPKFRSLLNASRDGLNDSAADPLDRMYKIILDAAVEKSGTELPALQQLLASLLSARMTLSIAALGDLLGREPSEVRASLSPLHSVVHVPETDNKPGLRTVHASFGDYLFSRASDRIHIPKSLGHDTLANACLNVMDRELHFNISQTRSSYKPNPSTQPESITPALAYACLQWVYHVTALPSGILDNKLNKTFRPKLLAWLEVMSLLRQVWRAARMLFIAVRTVKSAEFAQFLRDANSFVASSRDAIERSAPHIYLSALAFADKNSLVYRDFAPKYVGLIAVDTFGIGHHGRGAVMTLIGHTGGVRSVAYSLNGELLASGADDGTVRVWDTLTGEETLSPLRSGDISILSLNFAPNTKWLASGTKTGTVCVWDLVTRQTSPRRLIGHSDMVNSVKFSRDNSQLASASSDKTVRLWNPETGAQLWVLQGHTGPVYRVGFSPKAQVITSVSGDRTIRMWNVDTKEPQGEPIPFYTEHTVDFSRDGVMIAGIAPGQRSDVSLFSNVLVWNRWTRDTIAVLKGESAIRFIRFSPDSRSLAAAHGQGVRVWTLQPDPANAPWVDLGGHLGQVNWVTFSPDGLYIASASDDGTIRIWIVGSGQLAIRPLPAHVSSVSSVAVPGEGAFIVSGSYDESVRVWNAGTGDAMLAPLHGHTRAVRSVAISPEERLIASGSEDGIVQLWNARSGVAIGKPISGHSDDVSAVTFSHDGRWLASASSDKTVRIWDVMTLEESTVSPLSCRFEASAVVFSPDGKFVAAGDVAGEIRLWRTATGKQAYEPLNAHPSLLSSLAFSPNGTHIVSGGIDKIVRIWVVGKGHLRDLTGHTNSVRSVTWSRGDDRLIGTGSDDKTVRLWNATTGELLATLRGHVDRVRSVAFTLDGKFIVSGSDDTMIRKWDVSIACKPALECGVDPAAALESATLKHGWLVGPSGELLLWVPDAYRQWLQPAFCTLQIGRSRVVVRVGDQGLHAGSEWTLIKRNYIKERTLPARL